MNICFWNMDKKKSALYSEYIIDGVAMELAPARLLESCLSDRPAVEAAEEGDFAPILDETIDPDVRPIPTGPEMINTYLKLVRGIKKRSFPKAFPESFTKGRIALALIDAIWRKGHFRLGDLGLSLSWNWSSVQLGDMACFYSSVQSAVDYLDMLGLRLKSYSYDETGAGTEFIASCSIMEAASDAEETFDGAFDGGASFFDELPFRTEHPRMGSKKLHPSTIQPDPASWLIYIPFEQCDYRLGASALSQAVGLSGSLAPQIIDADYFIDCYEVVRELVEDNIILSGATVGDGGLMAALKAMSSPRAGADVELADLVASTGERDIVKLLFAELPGVIIQISDNDYDYVDAELLLQDVLFFPLGHPIIDSSEVRVHSSEKSGVQVILESIIRSQNSEGED